MSLLKCTTARLTVSERITVHIPLIQTVFIAVHSVCSVQAVMFGSVQNQPIQAPRIRLISLIIYKVYFRL